MTTPTGSHRKPAHDKQAKSAGYTVTHWPGEYIKLNGRKFWVEMAGTGDPIVIIAGGPGSSHGYLHALDFLAEHFRVIFFDAYGCGKTERAKNHGDYTFRGALDDLEALRRALGYRRWSVVGHSYGGLAGQGYGLTYPQSIAKLVLANTLFSGEMFQQCCDNANYSLRQQYPEVWAKVAKLRAQGYLSSHPACQAAVATVDAGMVYFYNAANAAKTVFDINLDVYHQFVGPDAEFHVWGELAQVDFRSRLKNLHMPTLITAGRFDRVCFPSLAVQFRRFAPQAQFVMFEKSGHLPFLEETEKHERLLRSFLRDK